MRELRRARHPDWPKLLRWCVDTSAAALHVSRSWHLSRFRMRIGNRVISQKLPTLLITNNALALGGEERALDRGVLAIYIPREHTPARLLWLSVRVMLRGPKQLQPLDVHLTDELVLERFPAMPLALDGEAHEISAPVRLRSRHAACWVRAPIARTTEK